MINKKLKKLLIFIFLATVSFAAGITYYYTKQEKSDVVGAITDLDRERDSAFILRAFKDDWYWLVADESTFDPEKVLVDKAYPQEPYYKGNLTIKVGYQEGKPVGFVAYYTQSILTGKILFLYVTPEFRSQRWGRRLLDYAVKDLTKRGVIKVELVTRTNNEASQRLYTRYGFVETHRYDPGYVDFVYLTQK